MTAFWVFVLAGIGTYAARAVFIVGVGDRELPPVVERGLLYVGPAVLAALTASLLTSPDGVVAFLENVPEVAGSIVGVAAALRFRRFDVSFVAALTVFFALTALL
ncbi:MAG: AzlD domain-containing protein [Acidimicrobiia bacterium]|nr:AzlD domain-containing protein [Acidimicrobiia bacterium]